MFDNWIKCEPQFPLMRALSVLFINYITKMHAFESAKRLKLDEQLEGVL